MTKSELNNCPTVRNLQRFLHESETKGGTLVLSRDAVKDIYDLMRCLIIDEVQSFETKTETVFSELGETIRNVNKANGWPVLTPEQRNDIQGIATRIALMHSELSEALEELRKPGGTDWDCFTTELADVIIRILDTTHQLGLDMGTAVLAKIEKNKARGWRHGGKAI